MKTTNHLLASLPLLLASALVQADSQGADPLRFPKDAFTVETKTVKTSFGEHKVVYHSYLHIPYVAKPVDKDYQSLNVSVPVEVDGKPVDASRAPILFGIGVGGYMSSPNVRRAGAAGPPAGPPGAGAPGGAGGPPGGPPGGGPPGSNSKVSNNQDLALAAGYVVVAPGARGRDNKAADGTFYGKAPAAIIDLKAAVRYVHHNRGVIPGDTDRIVSVGGSAGGALSALLGASGDSPLYASYLKELGAAEASDAIFASADFCPITDLDHADMAYDWMYGSFPKAKMGGSVDAGVAKELAAAFAQYEASLNLQGRAGFGKVDAANFGAYTVKTYLVPSANKYLAELAADKRQEYLQQNPWITWNGTSASFSWADYVQHVGRLKGQPAFDDFAMKSPETNLFGNRSTDSRHFTDYSLARGTGQAGARLDPELREVVNLMNPMYFITRDNKGMATHWWIRHGSKDNDTALPVIINLATSLENRGRDVNALLYWDAPHGADEDPEDFIAWIGKISGAPAKH